MGWSLKQGGSVLRTIDRLANLAAVIAVFVAVPAWCNVQTWDWDDSNLDLSSTNYGNTLTFDGANAIDGITLVVSGWSDTANPNDNVIRSAALNWQQSGQNLGLCNRDEGNGGSQNTCSSSPTPSHAIDSYGNDYDMLLLTFSTAVNLTGIDIGWQNTNPTPVSILAWTGPGSAALSGQTWSSIRTGAPGGAYQTIGNYAVPNNTNYYSISNNVTSTNWLVGIYNPIFDSNNQLNYTGDYALKLNAVRTQTTPPPVPGGQIPLPGTAVLLLLGLAALRGQRQKTSTISA